MDFNRFKMSQMRKESAKGERERRLDLHGMMESLRQRKAQLQHGFEFLIERYSELAESVWLYLKLRVRGWFTTSTGRVLSFVRTPQEQPFVEAVSSYQDETSQGDFGESRFSVFISGLKRKYPRYANGRLLSFVTDLHQWVMWDRFQLWCGLICGMLFWLGLITIYQWIVG